MNPDAVRDSVNRMTPGGYRRRPSRWPGIVGWTVVALIALGVLAR